MRMCHFWAQNGPFALNKNVLVKTINITFNYLLVLFIVQNFNKILTADPESLGCTIFGPKMVHLLQTRNFRKKFLLLFSSTYWPLSLCKILKKFLRWIQSYEDAPFLDPKLPICPNKNFFRKPINKPCSFHSCLSTCQKSKSYINLLIKYWQLKNTEISLAESHFWL